jgi:L-iditol 2-dehydrogenase
VRRLCGREVVLGVRALVWHAPRQMSLEHVPDPLPGPGEALLRVEAVGICGSELSGYLGENSLRRPPLVMGHEFSAVVLSAPAGGRLQPGQRVVVNPLLTCGECVPCRRGAENLCLHRRIVGAARPGAFAELVAVPEAACHPAPEVPPAVAAMAEPLACAVRAWEVGGIGLGDAVLILGAGAIGLFVLAVARLAGAALLAVADPNVGRLETARAWGATHVLGPGTDVPAEVRRLTGGLGVDVAVDAVGVGPARLAALRAVRPGGGVVLLGLHDASSELPVNEVVRGETRVTGCFCYRAHTFARALDLLQRGLLRPGPWLQERPLEAGPEAFEELLAGRVAAAKVVLRP